MTLETGVVRTARPGRGQVAAKGRYPEFGAPLLAERRLILLALDLAAILVALIVAQRVAGEATTDLSRAVVLAGTWLASAFAFECYDLRVASRTRSSLIAIFGAIGITLLSVLALSAADVADLRPFGTISAVGVWAIMSLGLLGAVRSGYVSLLTRPELRRRVAVVGDAASAQDVVRLLKAEAAAEYEVVRVMTAEGAPMADASVVDELVSSVRAQRIQEVILASGDTDDRHLALALIELYESGVEVRHSADVYEELTGRVAVERLGNQWITLLPRRPGGGRLYEAVRRGLDIVIAAALLVPAAPILGLLAVLVRIDSPGPVVFRQQRVGRLGRPFTVLKLRTMVADAETDGPVWARRTDPRRTRLGRFMRPTRLDEIPQLWNVLVGEMTLIGPRPERPEFVQMLSREIPHYRARHLVRPGLSGWAQVKFQYAGSVEDSRLKLHYDLYYVKHRAPLLDLVIAMKTIAVLLRARGR